MRKNRMEREYNRMNIGEVIYVNAINATIGEIATLRKLLENGQMQPKPERAFADSFGNGETFRLYERKDDFPATVVYQNKIIKRWPNGETGRKENRMKREEMNEKVKNLYDSLMNLSSIAIHNLEECESWKELYFEARDNNKTLSDKLMTAAREVDALRSDNEKLEKRVKEQREIIEQLHAEDRATKMCTAALQVRVNELLRKIEELEKGFKPEPLTLTEKGIFLAAMRREEKACEDMLDTKGLIDLVRVCQEIERKVKKALWTN